MTGDLESGTNSVSAAALVLARWWSRPIAPQLSHWAELAEVATEMGRQLDAPVPDAILAVSLADASVLSAEYEHLFVGPGPVSCPPYESYWRKDVPVNVRGALMGPCVPKLRELYARLGIAAAPEAVELPDHVAVEFEALAYALSQPGDDARDTARTLVAEHLTVWLPSLCQAVAREAREPFYTELAALTPRWFEQIAQCV